MNIPRSTTNFLLALSVGSGPVSGQVTIHPTTVTPASMERFALRVASSSDTTSRILIRIPDAVTVLGVERSPDWPYAVTPATRENSATIEWSGGPLQPGEFREFAFFARLAGDARRRELIFPVKITRADGSAIEYSLAQGSAPPPVVQIVGSTAVSPWGAVGLAGVAVAIAIISLGLSASRPRGGRNSA